MELDDIVARWRWERTGGGLSNSWWGPDIEGYDHVLIIRPDGTATAEWDGNTLTEPFTMRCNEPAQGSRIRFATGDLFPMYPADREFTVRVVTRADTTRLYLRPLWMDGIHHHFILAEPSALEGGRSWGSVKATFRTR